MEDNSPFVLVTKENKASIPTDTWKANKITDGLYLGSIFDAQRLEVLKQRGVTHILSLGNEFFTPKFSKELEYFMVAAQDADSQELLGIFEECISWMDKVISNGGTILAHCAEGKSRSATIVIAYLMRIKKLPLNEALKFVKEARNRVNPNPGFLKQLEIFESVDCDMNGEKWKALSTTPEFEKDMSCYTKVPRIKQCEKGNVETQPRSVTWKPVYKPSLTHRKK